MLNVRVSFVLGIIAVNVLSLLVQLAYMYMYMSYLHGVAHTTILLVVHLYVKTMSCWIAHPPPPSSLWSVYTMGQNI